jgi:hypothetical protein
MHSWCLGKEGDPSVESEEASRESRRDWVTPNCFGGQEFFPPFQFVLSFWAGVVWARRLGFQHPPQNRLGSPRAEFPRVPQQVTMEVVNVGFAGPSWVVGT